MEPALILLRTVPQLRTIRHLWLGIRRSSVCLVIYIVIFIVYLITGAITFSSLERPADLYLQHDYRRRFKSFLQKYPSIPEQELVDLVNEGISVYSNGGVASLDNSTIISNWNFDQAFFFVVTLVTTVGYGQASPVTEGGKAFCIIYCIIGIPMNIVLMTSLVDRLMVPTTRFLQFLVTEWRGLVQPYNVQVLHLVFVGAVSLALFFLIPALIFSLIEPDWTYLDGVYFCFVSLTTIGLGDLVPGESPMHQRGRPFYKLATAIYLLVGLVFVLLVLTVFYGIPQLNVGDVLLLKSDDEELLATQQLGYETKPLLENQQETNLDANGPVDKSSAIPAVKDYGSLADRLERVIEL